MTALKTCYQCHEEKPLSEFYKDIHAKGGHVIYCKTCIVPYHRRHNILNRQRAVAVLGGKCIMCGITDARVLQIDHINGGGKKERDSIGVTAIIYKIIRGGGINEYQLLCANCNWIKRFENNEAGNWKYLPNQYDDFVEQIKKKKQSCVHGHEYTLENTYIFNNKRMCIECRKIKSRKLVEERKQSGLTWKEYKDIKRKKAK